MSDLPMNGHVLGIDVGYSEKRKTTGFCLLSWDDRRVAWACERAGSDEGSRANALEGLQRGSRHRIDAVAIDGPLCPGLQVSTAYRSSESILSRGKFQRRGKPGPTNGGGGPRLHQAATQLARFSLERLEIRQTRLRGRVCDEAIVEAFPNLFLGVLCNEADYPDAASVRRRWTDALFPRVHGNLSRLLASLLPGREICGDLELRGHEEIAALTCALTALCASTARFVAVGSVDDGFILFPPTSFWGTAMSGPSPWASAELDRTLTSALRSFPNAERWEGDRAAGLRHHADLPRGDA